MADKKKFILIGLLFLLFLEMLVVIYFLVNNKKEVIIREITGSVIVADDAYIIMEYEGEDYLITNIKGNYSVGDEVKVSFKSDEVLKDESPHKIVIIDEELIRVSEENKTDNNIDDDIEENDSNENSTNNDNQVNNNGSTINSTGTNNSSNTTKPSSNNSGNTSTNNTTSNNGSGNTTIKGDADSEVISYFNTMDAEFKSGSIKDSLKTGFVSVVDFLFYGGTIKGYTFSELSNSAKLKVLTMALYFDSKIDKYFPGYKESISNTTSKIYTGVKEKIVSSYLNITTSICSSNAELCVSAKEGFQELKTNFGLTWSLIKEIASDGISNLKSWYEIWRRN